MLIPHFTCYHLSGRAAQGVPVGRSSEGSTGGTDIPSTMMLKVTGIDIELQTLWFKTRRATTEEPQASEKSRLDSPFPVTIDSTSRRSTLPATTNSTPRSSIAHEVKHRRTPTSSTTPTTTETDPVLTQPAKSKADGKVLKCPMTFSMYNDPSMLRDARDDLLNFLHLVENWLGEVEFDITLDVWGAAMTNLEKQERIV